jgi:PAS domain S-box-containing protein
MKANFLKKITTGRILIALYLLVCIMAAYNIIPILKLTNQSISRYNEIFSRSTRKFELMTQLRKNFNTIQSVQFKHVLAYSTVMMDREEGKLKKALEENNAIFSEYKTLVESATEQRYLDTVLGLRKINADTRIELIQLSRLGKRQEAYDYYVNTQEVARINYSNAVEDLTEYLVNHTNEEVKATADFIIASRKTVNILLGISVVLMVITGVVVFVTNKKLNVAYSEKIKEYQHFFINNNDFACIANVQGYFEIINHNFVKRLGYSEKELLENQFLHFIHPDDVSHTTQETEKLKTGTLTVHFVNRYRKREGDYLWLDWNITSNADTGKLYAIARDITDSKKAEAELKESNFFLNAVLENIPNMIFVKDADEFRFVRFNRAGEQLLGYKRNDLIGKNDYDFFPREQADFFVNKDREVIKKGMLLDIKEEKITTANGERWLHTKKIPVTDINGSPLYLLGISEDITDRKKAEEALEQLNRELEKKVEERTVVLKATTNELIENNIELQKINSELDRFVYSTSHDLRTPLLSLEGLLNLSQEHINQKQELQQYHDIMRKVIAQMDETIKEILDYSRNARTEIQPEQLNIQQMALNIKDNVSHITDRTNITFSLAADDTVPFYSDKSRVNTLINNLISNAYKYARCDEPNQYVKFSFSSDSAEGIIKVEDNGEGIADEYHEKIFEMFFRASEQYEGSGLGLYICREIVKRLKGSIEVHSTPSKGSTFIVRIPNMYKVLNQEVA